MIAQFRGRESPPQRLKPHHLRQVMYGLKAVPFSNKCVPKHSFGTHLSSASKSELEPEGELHSAHGDISLSTSEAPQSGDFAGLTRVNDHIWVAQHGMVKEVVIFPADLEKSTLVVERRVEAEFFPKRPLRHKFTRPNDASAGSVTIA